MFPLVDRQMHANYSEHLWYIYFLCQTTLEQLFDASQRATRLDFVQHFCIHKHFSSFLFDRTPQLPFEFVEFSFRGRLPLISCLPKLYQFISFHSVFIFDLFAEKTNIIFTQKFVPKRILNSLSVNFLFLDVYLNCVNIHFILQNILQPGIGDARSSDYTPRTRHRWHSSICG